MPAFLAASASALPTSRAWSVLSPLKPLSPTQLAPAIVLPVVVVDELREDAAVRAEHREARPLGGAGDLAAHAAMTAQRALRAS